VALYSGLAAEAAELNHEGHKEHKGDRRVEDATIPEEDEELGRRIVEAIIEGHRRLGSGFLEDGIKRLVR
jgi:hypothetical protein